MMKLISMAIIIVILMLILYKMDILMISNKLMISIGLLIILISQIDMILYSVCLFMALRMNYVILIAYCICLMKSMIILQISMMICSCLDCLYLIVLFDMCMMHPLIYHLQILLSDNHPLSNSM